MGIEENFFRGPIALEVLNRKEAGLSSFVTLIAASTGSIVGYIRW